MKFNLKATNLELTEAIHQYIDEKIGGLSKYLGDCQPTNCDFEVELTTHHHHKGQIFRAELNLSLPGELLRLEQTAETLYQAIDEVRDQAARVIKKYKETKAEIIN